MSGILEKFNFYDYEKKDELLEQVVKRYKKPPEKKSTKIKLAKCPICGKKVRLMCYEDDGSGIPLCVNYEEELDELNVAHGYIHCCNCDADFCKAATLIELIEWWNDRVLVNNVISNLKQFEEDYKYEPNWGFISQCIEMVENGM